MPKKINRKSIIPAEAIASKIYHIRGQKVILDRDLAEIYDVATKRLNKQVRRNAKRFPDDFMFQLTSKEKARWSQFATTSHALNTQSHYHWHLPNTAPLWRPAS